MEVKFAERALQSLRMRGYSSEETEQYIERITQIVSDPTELKSLKTWRPNPTFRELFLDGMQIFLFVNLSENKVDVPAIPPLHPLDMYLQIHQLKDLEPGWLEGDGEVPDPAALDWWGMLWEDYFEDVPNGYLFPCEDGSIIVEWKIPQKAMNLQINLTQKKGRLFILEKTTWDAQNHYFDMNNSSEVEQLAKIIRNVAGTNDE